MRPIGCLLAGVFLTILAPAQEATPPSRQQQALAGELATFAEWCQKNGFPGQAAAVAREALDADPAHGKAKALAAAGAGEDAADEAAGKKLAQRRAGAGKRIATLYCEVAAGEPPGPAARAPLTAAFRWDAGTADRLVESAWKKALAQGEHARAHDLLSVALAHETLGASSRAQQARRKALHECEIELAQKQPLLRQVRGHPMQYWLSLPQGWSGDREWPILVAVEGAGCNFVRMNGIYGGRDNRDFVVVTPCSLSNTNSLQEQRGNYPYPPELLAEWDRRRMEFDEAGLLALLADVRADFRGEAKVFVTGFSGGGNLTWQMVFAHPELLAAAAPACANFAGLRGAASTAPEREALPILVVQGEDDPFRPDDSKSPLDRQWAMARAQLEQHGYRGWSYSLVPKTGHAPCAAEVLAFFRKVAGASPTKDG